MASHRQDLPTLLSFALGLAAADSPIGEDLPTSPQIGELYVALKSKPMALLYGPVRSGKLDAARAIASHLAGPGSSRIQEMVGHAWWASGLEGGAVFTGAQERLNREKILALMEEAGRDRSAGAVYVALLSRISPAEWNDLATLAFHLDRGYVPGGIDHRALRRLRVSPRFLLIATADAPAPPPWDVHLLRKTSLLPWTTRHRLEGYPPTPESLCVVEQKSFLETAIRAPRSALRRLRSLTEWQDGMLKPLLSMARAMNLQGVPDTNRAANEAVVYMANAWTRDGDGLFAPSFHDNLRLAIRFAVKLAMAPRLAGLPPPGASAITLADSADRDRWSLADDWMTLDEGLRRRVTTSSEGP